MNRSERCFAYALETSSTLGSVALILDDEVVAETSFSRGLRHGTDLVPTLDALVAKARFDRTRANLVVVGIGPGSYTGLRVGLASAKALAFALRVPLVGVASSDAAAYTLEPRDGRRAAVVVDAKREQVYLSTYLANGSDWSLVGEHRILPPERAAELLEPGSELIGDGVLRYSGVFTSAGFDVPEGDQTVPQAGRLGILGVSTFRRTQTNELITVEPLYLRLSEAEERRARSDGSGQSTT